MGIFYLDREKDIKVEYEIDYDSKSKKYKLSYKVIMFGESKLLKNLFNTTKDICEYRKEFVSDINKFKINIA